MHNLIIISLFAPLVGFICLMLFSFYVQRKIAGILACSTVLISFVCLSTVAALNLSRDDILLYHWITTPSFQADFTLHVDHLSLLMSLIITGIGFLIHVYSTAYMDHDRDFARYFSFLNFFIFAMLLLVLAGDLVLLFVGWEGVGLASYFLIGFWYERPAAAQAASKAFIVNRVGDLAFLLGILYAVTLFGTSSIGEINATSPSLTQANILTVLLFIGAAAKSAQLPLHTWLPDAMEGPTPVSALIHAATMVTAGVYLIVRLHPLFIQSPLTLQIIGIIGAVTSLYAALCASGQLDLKKVLAYSTVSQLGLMFLACSAGAFYIAMFHLTTHAFMKSLLFLSAGNVIHMAHGITDMQRMGGLRCIFTKTHWLFLIGVLSMAGVPPLAAFFSKDFILEQEFHTGHYILYGIGLAASLLTGVYLVRAYCMTFLGKLPPNIESREASKNMLIPVAALAILSIFGGFLGYAFGRVPLLETYLQEIGLTEYEQHLGREISYTPENMLTMVGAIASVIFTYFVYTKFNDRLGHTSGLLNHSFYIDEIYNFVIVKPLKKLSVWIGLVGEPTFFSGTISLLTREVQRIAKTFQKIQSGQLRSYIAMIVIGAMVLVGYLAF